MGSRQVVYGFFVYVQGICPQNVVRDFSQNPVHFSNFNVSYQAPSAKDEVQYFKPFIAESRCTPGYGYSSPWILGIPKVFRNLQCDFHIHTCLLLQEIFP